MKGKTQDVLEFYEARCHFILFQALITLFLKLHFILRKHFV